MNELEKLYAQLANAIIAKTLIEVARVFGDDPQIANKLMDRAEALMKENRSGRPQ